ncbi:hypothetical protein THRCLA_23375 [Thraustotheca clavata]|uniref:Uncharacterized protein n=1 Tax=Thraustotheca clavata TaxID=74557 RepID=A0A1V9Y6S8_9STRA|nr:hypothetical protein THRCLA_23375 [Thraustotheca clavata]
MDDTDELEREWAARVIQQIWKEYTDHRWSQWRQSQEESNPSSSRETCSEGESSAPSSARSIANSSHSIENIGQLTPAQEVFLAHLESDPLYQTLAATENELDKDVVLLKKQQELVQLQQNQIRARQLAKEREEKERRKLARKRVKEIQQRRAEEEAKFRELETMQILRDVDFNKRTPHQPKKTRPRPTCAQPKEDFLPLDVPLRKVYPRLPNLGAIKPTPRAEEEVKPVKVDYKKTIACYAQDLTPLVKGEKPKRVKHHVPKPKKIHKAKRSKPLLSVSNQLDDIVDIPPPITLPQPAKKCSKISSSTPLTAEIKSLAWMSALQKEFEQGLLNEPPPMQLPTTTQNFTDYECTSTIMSSMTASPMTPMVQQPIAQVANTEVEATALLASRREFLMSKYGTIQPSVPEPIQLPNDKSHCGDSTDRLQSILNKYKVVATANDKITPSSTQSLLAKYTKTLSLENM